MHSRSSLVLTFLCSYCLAPQQSHKPTMGHMSTSKKTIPVCEGTWKGNQKKATFVGSSSQVLAIADARMQVPAIEGTSVSMSQPNLDFNSVSPPPCQTVSHCRQTVSSIVDSLSARQSSSLSDSVIPVPSVDRYNLSSGKLTPSKRKVYEYTAKCSTDTTDLKIHSTLSLSVYSDTGSAIQHLLPGGMLPVQIDH